MPRPASKSTPVPVPARRRTTGKPAAGSLSAATAESDVASRKTARRKSPKVETAKYLVKPGSRVNLVRWDPADKSALAGGKSARVDALLRLGEELDQLQDVLYGQRKHKLLIVLQGMDTSGKDGTIRRVFRHVDPLGVRVAAFKAPSPDELDHDYLWRIHRQVPGKGEITIFNRSHYEDVLITRVHGWVSKDECRRRYRQINEFEHMLAETGTTILKFYLHISYDEQRQRLQERLDNPDKRWKFNSGDLAERRMWADYMSAYQDAIGNTSAAHAPWYIVPANSNSHRDMVVASVIVETLKRLELAYPQPEENLAAIRIE